MNELIDEIRTYFDLLKSTAKIADYEIVISGNVVTNEMIITFRPTQINEEQNGN